MAAATVSSEAKAEVKDKEVEEYQEHLNYKTWVLKVSIHCEGCKRKVKKILTNIDGVYTTNIDLRQQKVIVTGDVDAETLIRKLEKNGKRAELWPEIKAEQKKQKKKSKASKNKEKQQLQSDPESSEDGNNSPLAAGKETVKDELGNREPPSKGKESENGGTVNGKVNEVGGGTSATGNAGGQVKQSKSEVKHVVISAAGGQPLGVDKKVGGESDCVPDKSAAAGGGGSGSGSGGKKKKKKGHKGNNSNNNNNNNNNNNAGGAGGAGGAAAAAVEGEPCADATLVGAGSLPIHGPGQGPMPHPADYSPPHQHGYPYPAPPQYYAPPFYAVSHSTAYPSISYRTSHYAAPTPYSYAYMYPATGAEHPPSDMDSNPSPPSSDSFEIFSDENPNACSIM